MPLRNPYALDTPVSPHAKFRPRRPLDTPIAPTPPPRYGVSARQDFERAGLKGVMQGLGQVGIEAVKPYADIWREASKPFLQGPLGPYISGEAYTPEWKQYHTDARSAQTKLREATGKVYIPPADVPAAMRQANLTPSEMTAAYRAQEELERMGLAAARATGVTAQMTLPQLMDMAQERGEFLLQRGQDDPIQPTGLHSASAVSRAHPTLGPFRPFGWLHFLPGSRIPFANWLDSWTDVSLAQTEAGDVIELDDIDPSRHVMGAPGQIIRFQPQAWRQELLGALNPEETSWATADYLDHLVASNTYIPTEPEISTHSNLSSLLDRAGALRIDVMHGMSSEKAVERTKKLLDDASLSQKTGAISQVDIPDWEEEAWRGTDIRAIPDDIDNPYKTALEVLDELYDKLDVARRNISQFWKPPPPIRNVPIEELAATPLHESPYGPYLAPGQAPVHPMNEVIANYGMPRIPAGWPPGTDVQMELRWKEPRFTVEQVRLAAWQEYLYENPGALSVPSTQRVAGVYGPPWGEDPEEGSWSFGPLAGIGHPPGTLWREIAEELGVPYIETGK